MGTWIRARVPLPCMMQHLYIRSPSPLYRRGHQSCSQQGKGLPVALITSSDDAIWRCGQFVILRLSHFDYFTASSPQNAGDSGCKVCGWAHDNKMRSTLVMFLVLAAVEREQLWSDCMFLHCSYCSKTSLWTLVCHGYNFNLR